MRAVGGDGFSLEPQIASHAEAMFEVLSAPALYLHEGAPPASVDWLRSRFARLESRVSPDGAELWLNWVIRLEGGPLAGYVQATVRPPNRALIAYVLGSAYWGRGLGRSAVRAMLTELDEHYGVSSFFAILKRSNGRSLRLLDALGFVPGDGRADNLYALDADELLRHRVGLPP